MFCETVACDRLVFLCVVCCLVFGRLFLALRQEKEYREDEIFLLSLSLESEKKKKEKRSQSTKSQSHKSQRAFVVISSIHA